MDIAKKYSIPMIIAINKVDSDQADPDQLVFDLIEQREIEVDEIGGEVLSARISALTGLGFEELEDRIQKTAERMKLVEDYKCSA